MNSHPSAIAEDLLRILVCPQCRAPVAQTADGLQCTAAACGLLYPVRDGIPVMLIDQATRPPRPTDKG